MADIKLSTMPQRIDVEHYAGDTLIMHIKITPEAMGGRDVFAQVRTDRHARTVAATFEIVDTAEGVDIVLKSADNWALAAHGDFEGVWDVQLAMPDGSDPVTTLGYGDLLLYTDVTRVS